MAIEPLLPTPYLLLATSYVLLLTSYFVLLARRDEWRGAQAAAAAAAQRHQLEDAVERRQEVEAEVLRARAEADRRLAALPTALLSYLLTDLLAGSLTYSTYLLNFFATRSLTY